MVIARWARLARFAGTRLVGGILTHALSDDEQTDLTTSLYDAGHRHGAWQRKGLDPWEERWLRDRLPPPPARIVVTGAGAGREAAVLADRGYHVDCLEPAAGMAEACKKVLAGRGQVLAASHDDLIAAALAGAEGPAASLLAAPYDGALVGWGALAHTVDRQQRRRLLEACHVLCPKGPILASFLSSGGAPPAGAAFRLGARIGGSIARVRGLPTRANDLAFLLAGGILRHVQKEELEEASATLDRELVWAGAESVHPHASLLRREVGSEVEGDEEAGGGR